MKGKTRIIQWLSIAICGVFLLTAMAPGLALAEDATADGWIATAFGQSTDINFKANVLEEKIGTNFVYPLGSDEPLPFLEPLPLQDVTIESRGGKVAVAHDGMTFYYKQLPTSENFMLTAKMHIEQMGPEVEDTAANLQEGCGIVVRDVIGSQRNDPLILGFEEYPAASNVAGIWVDASKKEVGADLHTKIIARYGVNDPAGTETSVVVRDEWLPEVGASLADAQGEKTNNYDATMVVQLERTDETFILRTLDENGAVLEELNLMAHDPNITAAIVQNVDPDNMYVGLFASRNARVNFTDVSLTTSAANTVAVEQYVAKNKDDAAVYITSSAFSNAQDYALQVVANYDGKAEWSVNDQSGSLNLVAGIQQQVPVKLAEGSSQAKVSFEVANPELLTGKTAAETALDIEVASYPLDLIVSADAEEGGRGTAESPMRLEDALARVMPGGTISALEGTYGPVLIPFENAGNADAPKSLIGQGKVTITHPEPTVLFQLDGSYWHIENIDIDGAEVVDSLGLRISGSHNTITRVDVHHTKSDAGILLRPADKSKSLAPAENRIINCTSYYNIDASRQNADGFGVKGGCGENNVFIGCIAYGNADDGWDLFNNIANGPNGKVIIENSIAYNNDINGFKLGGEARSCPHEIRNSIAFNNGEDGFTDNFNPGSLLVENNTSFNNGRFNFIFRPSPYIRDAQGNMTSHAILKNNLSVWIDFEGKYDDSVVGEVLTPNHFIVDGKSAVTAEDFQNITPPELFDRLEDGSIDFGTFLRLTAESALNTAGEDGTFMGALDSK